MAAVCCLCHGSLASSDLWLEECVLWVRLRGTETGRVVVRHDVVGSLLLDSSYLLIFPVLIEVK